MRAGNLRHRVIIQHLVETLDEYKTPTITWQDYATVWASVEPIRGREYIELQNTNSELTVRIRIRYLPGVTNDMRVLYGSRVFNIQSVIDINERHREMELMCIENTGDS